MAQYEKHGAKGKMFLVRDWEESSSTHVERFDDYELMASEDEKSVVLVKSSGTKNFAKSSESSFCKVTHEISVEDLIELIKCHPKRL
jgi:hypothetical protein